MSDEPGSALLHLMRPMDEKLDQVIADLASLKPCVTAICSGLHSSAAGRALIGLNRLTFAGIIGGAWLTVGDRGRGLRDTGLQSSAPAHAP